MKKKLTRIWGIGLVIVLLSTLFIAGGTASGDTLRWSVQPTPLGIGFTYQLAAESDASFVKVASNGDIFAVDTGANSGTINRVFKSTTGGLSWTPSAALPGIGAMNIVDLAISPSYETDGTVVVVATPAAAALATSQVYISTNGGASFAVLGGTVAGLATSVAIAPTYSGSGEIMVGVTDANNVGGTYGDVYFWARGGVLNWVTAGTALTEDVTTVAYSPNFAIDATRLCIGSNAVAAQGTRLHTLVSNDAAWDATLTTVAIIDVDIQDTGSSAAGVNEEIISSTMAIPSDFNASSMFARTCYVGTISTNVAPLITTDNLYRIAAGSPAAAVNLDPLTAYVINDHEMSSLIYSGTIAAGTLYTGYSLAPIVMSTSGAPTATAFVPPSWMPSMAAPTGATNIYLDFAADYTTSNRLYAGSQGANSALSISDDGGTYFYQAGLIDTVINSITDFQTAGSATDLFMFTEDGDAEYGGVTATAGAGGVTGGVGTAGVMTVEYTNQDGVARTVAGGTNGTITITDAGLAAGGTVALGLFGTDTGVQNITAVAIGTYTGGAAAETLTFAGNFTGAAMGVWTFTGAGAGGYVAGAGVAASADSVWKSTDGVNWYRMLSLVTAANNGIIRPSPEYATDATVYVGNVTSGAGGNVQVTNNGGASWTGRSCPIAVGDIAVKDQYTAYISLSGAGGTVQSTDSGGWTWQIIPTVTVAAQTITDIKYDASTGHIMVGLSNGGVYLSTDNNVKYNALMAGIGGTNTIVAFDADYANNNFVYAGSAAGAVADVYRFEVGTYTAWLAMGSAVPAASVRDLLVAPDGAVYVSDVTAGAGFSRTINPTAGTATVSRVTWDDAVGAGLTAASTITILARSAGSNVVYGVDAATNFVYTYTDTMSAVAPVATSPTGGPIVDAAANPVIFMWEAVDGALSYRVRYDTRDDFLTATTTTAATDPQFPTTMFVILPGTLANGFDYYWQVRVQTPVVGPYCDAQSFTTQLAAANINAPAIRGAVEGGTAIGGWDANINPTFQWGPIANATGYEFQLARDYDMTDLIVDASGANALGVTTAYTLIPAVATLDYNTTYYWRVKGISASTYTDWSTIAAFTTMAEPAPPVEPVTEVTVEPAEVTVPEITIPEITVPPAQVTVEPTPIVEEPAISTGYLLVIIIIGAVLVIAVIVLIVRTRRSV